MRKLLTVQEIYLKDNFIKSLDNFCKEDYKALCNNFISLLYDNFLNRKINTDQFRKLIDDY